MNSHYSFPPLRYTYAVRIFFLLLYTFAGLMIALIAMSLMLRGGYDTMGLRLGTVTQDLLLFIAPALMVAAKVTAGGGSARLLCVDRLPDPRTLILAILTMLCLIPVINLTVAWNESLTLPPSLAPLEEWMRQAEEAARQQVEILLGGTSAGDLTVSLLIVGVLAGLSEELFFRGALQRLLSSGPLNHHVAIWLTAILFSVFHMQFFGFLPRVLLGAFFGYLLYWSGSIWLPALIHALNNSIVVVSSWMERSDAGIGDINTFGLGSSVLLIASVILACAGLYSMAAIAGKK